jgi:hypothetical protein
MGDLRLRLRDKRKYQIFVDEKAVFVLFELGHPPEALCCCICEGTTSDDVFGLQTAVGIKCCRFTCLALEAP